MEKISYKKSVLSKLRTINLIGFFAFVSIFVYLIFGMLFNILKDISSDLAYLYAKDAQIILTETYAEDAVVLDNISNSVIIRSWLKDEHNDLVKGYAFEELMYVLKRINGDFIKIVTLEENNQYILTPQMTYEDFYPLKKLQSEEELKWIEEVKKNTNDHFLSVDEVDNSKSLLINARLEFEKETLGIVTTNVNYDHMFEELFFTISLDEARGYVIDDEGNIKFSNGDFFKHLKNVDYEKENIYDVIENKEFYKKVEKIETLSISQLKKSITTKINGKNAYVSILPLRNLDWKIVVIYDKKALLPIAEIQTTILVCVILLAIYYFLAKKTSDYIMYEPFEKFIESLEDVIQGKSDELYGKDRDDEFKILNYQFKELKNKLANYNTELEQTVQKRTKDLIKTNAALEMHKERLLRVHNIMPIAILTISVEDFKLLQCNKHCFDLFGIESLEQLQHIFTNKPSELLIESNYKDYLKSAVDNKYLEIERKLKSLKGRVFWSEIKIYYLENKDKKDNSVMEVFIRDIQYIKDKELKLEKQAFYDNLTGIYNRRHLENYLSIFFNEETIENTSTALFIDIDYFKKINDKYGHYIGDYVLKEMAKVVSETIRKTEIFARWGGEEFIVIAPNLDIDNGIALAQRIRKNVEKHKFDTVGYLTISIGVSVRRVGDTKDSWLKRADIALYKAKETGRNKVCFEDN